MKRSEIRGQRRRTIPLFRLHTLAKLRIEHAIDANQGTHGYLLWFGVDAFASGRIEVAA
jgi:hypothetical protein